MKWVFCTKCGYSAKVEEQLSPLQFAGYLALFAIGVVVGVLSIGIGLPN